MTIRPRSSVRATVRPPARSSIRSPARALTLAVIAVIAVNAVIAAIVGRSAHAGDCTPPVNETCDGAIVISGDALPWTFTGPLGCVNDIIDKPYMDVFFRFDCTCAGEYTFDMCDSSGDTYIRIYTDGCGWTDGDEFAVNDDSCPGSPPNADPMLTVPLEAGMSYWIEVGTWRPDPPWAPPPNSPYTLRLSACATCAGDIDASGAVDATDLVTLLAAWGPCASCPADLDGSGDVTIDDLLSLLFAWGPCADG